MTTKDKAIDLYNKFRNSDGTMASNGYAKKQAIICVDEITRENLVIDQPITDDVETIEILNKRYAFWKEVKEELIKL